MKIDGRIGGMTLKALNRYNTVGLIRALAASRLTFLHRLSNWRRFGKGWGRRVTKVTNLALLLTKAHEDNLKKLRKNASIKSGE